MRSLNKRNKANKYWFLSYLGFGFGAVGMDLSYGLFNSFLTKYLTDVLYINAVFFLIIPPIARIWDGINDPMMGTIVDNTKSRFGKFRPWIVIGAVTNAVVLTLLFSNPGFNVSAGKTNINLYIYIAAMYFLWDMTNTMDDISYWSMVPALTNDPEKRNVVSVIPRFFSGAGQLIIIILTVKMVGLLGNGNEGMGYSRWAMACGLVLIIGSLVTVVTTKEHGSVPPQEKFTLKAAAKTIMANDQLLIFMLFAMLFNAGWYITNAMGIYYFDNVMGDAGLIASFGAVGGAGQAIGLFAMPVFSKKFTRRKVIQGAMGLTFFSYLGMLFFGTAVKSFPVLAFFCFLGCIGAGCMFVSQTATLADIVDYGEYHLGYRSESIIFSMKGFLQKLAYTIQSIIIALGLKISDYDGSLKEQTVFAKSTITFVMFVIPPILIFFSFVIFTGKYKLYGGLSKEVENYIAGGRKKEQALNE